MKIQKQGEFTEVRGGTAWGWCVISTVKGVPYVDTQGDYVPADTLAEIASSFALEHRAGKDNHQGAVIADVQLLPIDGTIDKGLGLVDEQERTGLVCGWTPRDPKELEKISRGERMMFSIGGFVEDSEDMDAETAKSATFASGAVGKARKFKRWRLSEVSIVSRGAQEGADICVVKSADADLAKMKAAASHEAELALRDAAYEKRIVTEMLAHNDDIAKQHGYDAARRAAEVNKTSAGNWGAVWLEKNPTPVEKAAEPDAILKAAEQRVVKARRDYNARIDALAKQQGIRRELAAVQGIAADKELRDLYQKMSAAEDEAEHLPIQMEIEKSVGNIDKTLADTRARMAKSVEDLSIARMVPAHEAQAFLLGNSPTFKADWQQASALEQSREVAMLAAEQRVEVERMKSWEMRKQAADAADAESRRRKETPAEKALREHVESLAKASGERYELAFVKALQTDEQAQDLYAATQERN